jgi:hypothetical protein
MWERAEEEGGEEMGGKCEREERRVVRIKMFFFNYLFITYRNCL